jgi:opacity protein-like surface antigen
MANLIVRYPGETIIPYAGAGLGISHSFLSGTTIPGATDTDLGGSWTLGYQFLAGVQGNLTNQIFLFGEYKYFAANYHWEQLALNIRRQYLLGGIG